MKKTVIFLALLLINTLTFISATQYILRGEISDSGHNLYPLIEIDLTEEPIPDNSDYYISLYEDSILLKKQYFEGINLLNFYGEEILYFHFSVEISENANNLKIYQKDKVLLEFDFPKTTPQIDFVNLENLEPIYNITWSTTDVEDVYYTVYYSSDLNNWRGLIFDTDEEYYEFDSRHFAGRQNNYFKIHASNFINYQEEIITLPEIPEKEKMALISNPKNNAHLYESQGVYFSGFLYSLEQGEIKDADFKWYDDNILIGEGKNLIIDDLTIGSHNIKLEINTGTQTYEDEIKINIVNDSIQKYSLELNNGWNLISIPLILLNNSIESVFHDIYDDIEIVYSFDKDGAKTFIPGLEDYADLNDVSPYEGYYIKMKNARELEFEGYLSTQRNIGLNSGWNLISYLGDEKRDVLEVFEGINGLEIVEGFDKVALAYIPSIPIRFSTLKELNKGFGYWVKVNESFPRQTLEF